MFADEGINLYQQTSRHRDVDTLGLAVELFHINIHQQPLPASEILRTTFQMRFHITRKRQCIIHFKQRFEVRGERITCILKSVVQGITCKKAAWNVREKATGATVGVRMNLSRIKHNYS